MASSDVSSVTSHFSVAAEGFITTTSGSILSGAATIPLTSVSGLTNGNIFVGIIEPGLAKEQTFTGTVDTAGTQITGVVWTRNSNAAHSGGVTIVDYVTGTGHNMFTKGLLVAHNQDGTHKTGLLLTTPKVATSINDTNGNEIIKTPATGSAVNEITVTNAAAGTPPTIAATGNDSVIFLNLKGKGLGGKVTIGVGSASIFAYDYVVSGCVWTADSVGVNLNASATAGVVVINGNPITVAAVTAHAVTLNVDTYIDILDNGDGTGLYVYTTSATNAASQTLASNSIRICIIQAAATITATTKVNQGQEDRVFPIASSIAYTVTDSLGNLICPRDPNRKILGYRQITANITGTSITQAVGLTCPVIVPTGRKVKVSSAVTTSNDGVNTNTLSLWDGVVNSGTQIQAASTYIASGTGQEFLHPAIIVTPSSSSKTYNAGLAASANTMTVVASSTRPAYIMVELV